MPSRARARNYTDAEDAVIARMVAEGRDYTEIADEVGREHKSLVSRVYVLRRMGVIAGYETRKPAETEEKPLAAAAPPLILNSDDDLVRYCLAEGGFPRAVLVGAKTVWASHDMGFWMHKPPQHRWAA